MGILRDAEDVKKAAHLLKKMGYVHAGKPFLDEGDERTFLRLDLSKVNANLRRIVNDRSATQDVQHEKNARSETEKREGKDRYGSSSWQYKWAKRWWQRMEKIGRINDSWRNKKEDLLQEWADAFDYCIRNRDVTRKDLALVLRWLFQWDDFWIQQGAIKAPTKFKTRLSNEEWCIVHMLEKAKIERENRISLLPKEDETITEWELENKIIDAFGEEVRSYFESTGFGTGRNSDEKVYSLTVDRDSLI